jgi:hypothetical protein
MFSWKNIWRKLKMPGTATFPVEVSHISKNGLWLLLEDEELLLSYEQFPWFRKATIEQISHVERPSKNHLYWPDLDIDLSVESIHKPSAFPLIAKGTA